MGTCARSAKKPPAWPSRWRTTTTHALPRNAIGKPGALCKFLWTVHATAATCARRVSALVVVALLGNKVVAKTTTIPAPVISAILHEDRFMNPLGCRILNHVRFNPTLAREFGREFVCRAPAKV